tara:strand:+ start:94 stop:354 length:261 start_codon:yes stop_codon:yes gene_type:complete
LESAEESIEAVKEYLPSAANETKLKRIAICEDRDKPGVMISIVEFASWEDASQNNDLEVTNETVEKEQAKSDVNFRNLDVHAEWEL